jgi:hypothetical protein
MPTGFTFISNDPMHQPMVLVRDVGPGIKWTNSTFKSDPMQDECAVEVNGDMLIKGNIYTQVGNEHKIALITTADLLALEEMSVEEAVTHSNPSIRCLAKFLYRCAKGKAKDGPQSP